MHVFKTSPASRKRPSRARASTNRRDRKSTRLNSSPGYISYAVFCLKKKQDPESARDLVWIADLGVDPIEHHGASQPQRQAGGDSPRSVERTSALQWPCNLRWRLLIR